MNPIYDIFKQIESTSSRNDKENILQRNHNNETLKSLLEYIYNPFKVYGIGSKSFAKKYQKGQQCGFTSIFQLLDYLLENNTGSDEVKLMVNAFMLSQPDNEHEWIKRIILKDLKIGITEKTINKIWKGLVPTFDVMLAHPFDRLPKRAGIEIKLDGVRATAVKINGKTNLFTRNGKEIVGFNDIIKQLDNLWIDNFMFDGELISNNNFDETMEKVFKKSENKVADYMIFDMMPLSEFNNGKSTKTYEQRRTELANMFFTIKHECIYYPSLKLINLMTVLNNPTVEEINNFTKRAVEAGFEGVIVKDMDALYVCKRDYGWQKAKPFFDGDFEIIRIEEGTGKNKGKMGSVIIDVNGNECGLGSGWSDKEREDIWNNPNDYIGKIVEVQYQEITKDGVLRFPSVKGIRYDK
jgi:DNA ligase-1